MLKTSTDSKWGLSMYLLCLLMVYITYPQGLKEGKVIMPSYLKWVFCFLFCFHHAVNLTLLESK